MSTTPGRKTVLTFDIPETVALQPAAAHERSGKEISPLETSSNVEMLATGAWTLAPLQNRLSQLRELGDPTGSVVVLNAVIAAAKIVQNPQYHAPSNLKGATDGAAAGLVAGVADLFFDRRVTAGKSYALDPNETADKKLLDDMKKYPQPPPILDAILKLDRVIMTQAPAGKGGFLMRFAVPGNYSSSPEILASSSFGAAYTKDGRGYYNLVLRGDGRAELWENSQAFVKRDEWRWCEAARIPSGFHTMRVLPHQGNFKWIEFRASVNSEAGSVSFGSFGTQSPVPNQTSTLTHTYIVKEPDFSDMSDPKLIYGVGPLKWDVRRDLRIPVQLSVLHRPANGLLIDRPFSFPLANAKATGIGLTIVSNLPSNQDTQTSTFIRPHLFRADTGDEILPENGFDGPIWTYKAPLGVSSYFCSFEFLSNDPELAPVLWSYRVVKDGVRGVSAPGSFSGGNLREFSTTGPERDMTHETAHAVIEDLKAEMPRLGVRGQLSVSADIWLSDTVKSNIFRGYAIKPDGEQRGTVGGSGIADIGQRVYPSPDWKSYQLMMMGIWVRMMETLTPFGRVPLVPDFAATPFANGSRPGYKVTDVVRNMLAWIGFAPEQIDVPDNPLPILSTGADDASSQYLQPLQPVLTIAAQLLKDYLGWWLVWDGNAGNGGMIRARGPQIAPYRNLANFCTAPIAQPGVRTLATSPGAYPNFTINGVDVPSTFIARRNGRPTLHTYTKKPEVNALCVVGFSRPESNKRVQHKLLNWVVNPISFNFFQDEDGNEIQTANPDHPDYLGYIAPLVLIDPSLNNPAAINLFLRRYAQITMHAVRMGTFEAPLILLQNTGDPLQTQPRSLGYYDPVTTYARGKLSQWLIRNCNVHVQKDHVQWAKYEIEAPVDNALQDFIVGA